MRYQKPRLRLISRLQYRSILFKTLLLLTLFIAIVISSVYGHAAKLITQQRMEESQATQRLLLTETSRSFDTVIAQVGKSIDFVFSDTDVTGLLISPGKNDYMRLINVMQTMRSVSDNSMRIKRAYLYCYGNDMVYASDGKIDSIHGCPDKYILISCMTSLDKIHTFQMGDLNLGILATEGRIFLFRFFPGISPMALLAVEIESDIFYKEAMNLGSTAQQLVYMYDRNQIPLFQNFLTYPELGAERSIPEGFSQFADGGEITYCYRSETSGLVFLTVIRNQSILPSIQNILRTAGPFLAFLFFLCGGLAFLLIRMIYRPIQEVIYSMAASGSRNREPVQGNELEYIKNAYQDSQDERSRLSGILSDVTPEIADKVFVTLLTAPQSSLEEMTALLESIDSPFTRHSRYIVLAMGTAGVDGSLNLEKEINYIWFRNLCYNYWEAYASCHFLQLLGGAFSGVLCFPADTSSATAKKWIGAFRRYVDTHSAGLAYSWLIGTSQIHIGLEEIYRSGQEARADLRRQQYFLEEKQQGEEGTGQENVLQDAYFSGRIKQFLHMAATQPEQESAERGAILAAFSAMQLEPSVRTALCRHIHNAVMEELVKANTEPTLLEGREMALPADSLDHEAATKWLDQLLGGAFAAMGSAKTLGRKGHVENAQEYIADHYADSTLSLDGVSRHLGLSSPYFSKIFSETVGCGFLDYLNKYRIQKAKQLLSATELPISEVGFQVGFHSSQNFTRVFKRVAGVPPSKYRDEWKRI